MKRVLAMLAMLALCACGSARLIQRDRTGGVIQLGAGRDSRDWDKARQIMAEQCGGRAEVISEGEEPIGAKISPWGVRTQTAWRVHYQCRTTE